MYKLNFVEPNHRRGPAPWSTRHLGVYHHHRADSDLFILVHCSKNSLLYTKLLAERLREAALPVLIGLSKRPSGLHELVLESYVRYWLPYLKWLGEGFSELVSGHRTFHQKYNIEEG